MYNLEPRGQRFIWWMRGEYRETSLVTGREEGPAVHMRVRNKQCHSLSLAFCQQWIVGVSLKL